MGRGALSVREENIAMLWNQFDTKGKDSMTCEVIDIKGWNGDTINAYVARPGA